MEAVIKDLDAQAPDAVFHAGDLVNRCPWNNEVLDIVRERGWLGVAGNHEVVVSRISEEDQRPHFGYQARFADLWWSRETLDPAHLAFIREFPPELELDLGPGGPIRILHGVRGDPFAGILPESSSEEVQNALRGIGEPVVICAHTHRPLARSEGSRRIFNGGSVGMPYNGDPRAHYLLLSNESGAWEPDFRKVDYERTAVAAGFERTGFAETIGPLSEVFLRTILTGDPWASDFGYWLRSQAPGIQQDMRVAVDLYLNQHGPGHWCFMQRSTNGATG